MSLFEYTFVVEAPLAVVRKFHHSTSVLKTLTPPPILVSIHYFEPLANGSTARFTLWFGPLPIRWEVIHSEVDEFGFTDTQVRGPLRRWRHRHRFNPVNDNTTLVIERIEYEHDGGVRGLLSRFLFSRPALLMLFTARKMITRRHVKKMLSQPSGPISTTQAG